MVSRPPYKMLSERITPGSDPTDAINRLYSEEAISWSVDDDAWLLAALLANFHWMLPAKRSISALVPERADPSLFDGVVMEGVKKRFTRPPTPSTKIAPWPKNEGRSRTAQLSNHHAQKYQAFIGGC
jgi:hypothetical protein